MVEPEIPEELLHGAQWHSLQEWENMPTLPGDHKQSKVIKRAAPDQCLGSRPLSATKQQLLKILGK